LVPPRVRFAPSPTGFLHVGGARTALFNWLYARRHGGIFVLRIEDTDVERSSADMVTGILDGLRWLGLTWDEGPIAGGPHAPYFQSERLDRYRDAAARLLASGHAYACYCAPERLRGERDAAEQRGEAWQYDRACLRLTPDDRRAREAAGTPFALRFKVPAGRTGFDDAVHGRIEFDTANIEDFVILRSDRYPTYHLSVVVDDVDMAITDVIRGDDHISNTPKHVLLFEALGAPVPRFAHVPLILGADKKRLSKRHGATSVMEYERQGYLPEAMVNFLALLGWSPGATDQELFSREELVAAFDLRGISGGDAVFNQEKLDWVNQQHLFRLAPDELAVRLRPSFEAAGLWDEAFLEAKHAWFFAVLELLKPRAKKLHEFVEIGRFFFVEVPEYDRGAVDKHLLPDAMDRHLLAIDAAYAELSTFDPGSTEAALRTVADTTGVKAATVIHAVRVAVTGRTVSPGLFDVLSLLGRQRTRARLAAAVRLISTLRG
jgi:glutamyl-tRNA synthetase